MNRLGWGAATVLPHRLTLGNGVAAQTDTRQQCCRLLDGTERTVRSPSGGDPTVCTVYWMLLGVIWGGGRRG